MHVSKPFIPSYLTKTFSYLMQVWSNPSIFYCCKSVGEIWTNLDGLFNKNDVARLQLLENELAKTTQGDLSISQFFLKIKKFV
jgi:hypothetical protein